MSNLAKLVSVIGFCGSMVECCTGDKGARITHLGDSAHDQPASQQQPQRFQLRHPKSIRWRAVVRDKGLQPVFVIT